MLSEDTLATLTTRARRFGTKTAVVCQGERLSFLELDDRVEGLAAELRRRGLGPDMVATIYGAISLEWIIGYHAVLRTGAIVNPVNALLAPDEVAFIVDHCESTILLADRTSLVALKRGEPSFGTLGAIEFETFADYREGHYDGRVPPGDPDALANICYTSGTTGRPKGARLSHRNVLLNAGLTALMHGRANDDIIVSGLPLAHVYGNVIMNSSLLVGATLVLLPTFTPESAFEAIAANRATRFEGVPTMYLRMLEASASGTADLASLRMCTVGGQTMPTDKMRALETAFGCPLIELWGMSEMGGLGTTFPWTGPRTLGSVGVALPGVSLRTVDPVSREVLGNNEPGELQVRGLIVMDGYHRNEAGTREVLDADGWLSTGDIARIDGAGQVFVLDRIKDVILTSGNNVYPAEIERVISTLDGVVMVGVGRDTHPDKGEVPHAFVVVERTAELTAAQVMDHCRQWLAPYKLPRKVTFVDDLPKTSSGKILRRALNSTAAD